MANISFNPALTTQPQSSFQLETQGYIQGISQDDPTSRMWLSAGQVASGVTQPVWGGMGVTVSVGGLNSNGQNLTQLGLATTTEIQGFTVFDQAINMQIIPGNSVPTVVAGQSAAYYLFGSNARVPVPVASGSLTALETAYTNATLYWDTSAMNLTTTSSGTTVALPSSVQVLAVDSNSKAVSYNSGTGAVTWTYGQNVALIKL
ncbi:MAG: hypothetical protein B7X10_00115 [Burkholderiales bacterium 21-58-4]|nr:MAG: hypothetical protein B7X10_00115 [Burkholderiales bacterium 21-58-4]